MNEDVIKRIDAQDQKLAAIYESVEKTRKYFMWTLVITVAAVLLPMIGLVFVIPSFLNTLSATAGL